LDYLVELSALFASASGISIADLSDTALDHDPIESNRIMVWFFRWSRIFSENRHPPSDQVRGQALSGSRSRPRKEIAPPSFSALGVEVRFDLQMPIKCR
jgi:hypothetical protein